MSTETKTNLQSKSIWVRVLYMLLFVLAYSVSEFVLCITVVIQVIIKLVTGSLNENLKTFGKQISLYIYDVLQFLTFNSEDKPFPFDEWPTAER